MTDRDEATRAQITAARPDASTWLAANAGSGKTKVLTDRVARLLLDEVEPQHVLCLTYTKAAASEMQNRLFKRLGEWAMLPEPELIAALRDLGIGGEMTATRLKQARTLFARAIETPGGLKIQTIHSFCAALLRRFPLEAGVSPQIVEIEDRAADLLRAEVVDRMAEGAEADLIANLAQYFSGDDFGDLTKAIVREKEGFVTPLDWQGCLALFGQPETLTEESVEGIVFQGDEQAIFDAILPVMQASTATDQKIAQRLSDISDFSFRTLPVLENIFLYGSGAAAFTAKTGATSRPCPTKGARKKLGHIEPSLDAMMRRVETGRAARLALLAARKTHALHAFAARFLPLYEEAKTLRGWLDFDDLINRARALLSDEKVAAWVLFRIDGGIDHILVDEAQDTSPAQWDVVRKLAVEFTSGVGARADVERTIFVVGDKKQSIYSFQGADPGEFDRMKDEFDEKLEAIEKRLEKNTLKYSFRSAQAVLSLVDQTFENRIDAGFSGEAEHIAFKSALPGRVDLWPLVEPQKDEEDDVAWYEPVDRVSAHHHNVVLANCVAGQIKAMIDERQLIPTNDMKDGHHLMRPVRAGDFLILVQRRSALFSEIIRACKNNGLPIAGADRLKVGGELAVRDLAALLSFLSMPEDSLSLASALKSPLFGWTEQDLFDLAHRRTQDHLWQALRERSDEFSATMNILNDLRRNVDFLRPYDLIERILTRHGGRRKLLARLGVEAEDGINALLSQALAYERNGIPSLTGFLVWMETDDLEIKRQIDSNSDQIRVMTVHGAKGLEAPIVILPDCGRRINAVKDDIVRMGETPVWKTASDEMPAAMAQVVDAIKETQNQERLRLLYVALTRAEKWLIVAAAGDLTKEGDTWYQSVESALEAIGTKPAIVNGLEVRRFETGTWDRGPLAADKLEKPQSVTVEPYFRQSAPPPADKRDSVSASDLGGAKALAGDAGQDEETALAYGTLVHRFLEHLSAAPAEAWPDLAKTLTTGTGPDTSRALEEAQAVLENPELSGLFTPDTLSEVAVTADLGGLRLHGVIDRLVIEENRVLAVDFKTNQTVPGHPKDCPDGILRQMAAYAIALRQIYPDRHIETAVLWTNTCMLMPLPHEIVMASLQNTRYLDASAGGSYVHRPSAGF